MKKRDFFNFLSLICIFLQTDIHATDLKPWFAKHLQVQGLVDYRYQTYSSLDAPQASKKYSSDDSFVDASLIFVRDPFSLQVEAQFADTRKRNFDWDHVGLTARYLILDDNIGDPFSLSSGLTLSRAWREAVNDISSFHHGQNEAFFHLAIGRQKVLENEWICRAWSVLGLGTADRWTPWIVADAAYEWINPCSSLRYKLFVNTLWGCGNHKLRVEDFGGYSKINHQSIDLGLGITKQFDYYGTLSFNYSYRVYAHNYPNRASNFVVSYNYPFGPDADYYLLKVTSLFGDVSPF